MATNILKQRRKERQNYHKVPAIISETLIHTSNGSVTKLVINSKRTKITNQVDKLEFQSIVAQIQNTKAQLFLPSWFLVCQLEALHEKG